jgi:ring-1,2-phenylacetyl-CoA epoxidase subunit PaaE
MLMQLPEGFQEFTIGDIKTETKDVKTFVLSNNVDYRAGQFLTILSSDGTERRSYSFSSSPDVDKYPAITLKRIPNGKVSRELIDAMQPGDTIVASDPTGFFTLPESVGDYSQLFFFAAGIGITPIISLIKSALHLYPNLSITLIYSNRSAGDTVFHREIIDLREYYTGRFKVEFLFSSASDLTRSRLSKWLLPTVLAEYLITAKENVLCYVCGPFAYMRMVLLGLEEENMPAENIRKENFNTAVISQKVAPPDVGKHFVEITRRGITHHFSSEYPDTILSSAKKYGLQLPYSCENGICGTCVARCTSGRIWHRNNEVLTEKELNEGLVLTCTAYPVFGDVQLKVK